MNINTIIKQVKSNNIIFNICLIVISIFAVLIIALYNTAKYYKPLIPFIIVSPIVELIFIFITYKVYKKFQHTLSTAKTTIIEFKRKDYSENCTSIDLLFHKYFEKEHFSFWWRFFPCVVCFILMFSLYTSFSSFSPYKWQNSEFLRPIMMHSFFSQNTHPDKTNEYNYLVEHREQIKQVFDISSYVIDVTVEISEICENETFDIYWAYKDSLGNNYWLIFIYPDSSDGICSQPVFLISGEHMVIGESNYSMNRNPSSLL